MSTEWLGEEQRDPAIDVAACFMQAEMEEERKFKCLQMLWRMDVYFTLAEVEFIAAELGLLDEYKQEVK